MWRILDDLRVMTISRYILRVTSEFWYRLMLTFFRHQQALSRFVPILNELTKSRTIPCDNCFTSNIVDMYIVICIYSNILEPATLFSWNLNFPYFYDHLETCYLFEYRFFCDRWCLLYRVFTVGGYNRGHLEKNTTCMSVREACGYPINHKRLVFANCQFILIISKHKVWYHLLVCEFNIFSVKNTNLKKRRKFQFNFALNIYHSI